MYNIPFKTIFIIFTISLVLCRKNNITTHYNSGADKAIYSLQVNKDGTRVRTGKAFYYYENGKLLAKGFFNNGIEPDTSYGNSGVPRSGRAGVWRFYDSLGHISEKSRYENGLLDGLSQEWYPSGKLKYKKGYSNGKADGIYIWYYLNGNIKEEGIFKNGYKNGAIRWFFNNGSQKKEAIILDGKLNGRFRKWYPNGKLAADIYYRNDTLNGKYYHYDSLNEYSVESAFIMGKENGVRQAMYANGQKRNISHFKLGVLTDDTTYIWYKNGQLQFCCANNNGKTNGLACWWHPNGKLWKTGKLVDDLRKGDWTFWDSLGNSIGQITYKADTIYSRTVAFQFLPLCGHTIYTDSTSKHHPLDSPPTRTNVFVSLQKFKALAPGLVGESLCFHLYFKYIWIANHVVFEDNEGEVISIELSPSQLSLFAYSKRNDKYIICGEVIERMFDYGVFPISIERQ